MKPAKSTAGRPAVTVEAQGVRLAVHDSGPLTGVPVVLLHGFTGSAQAMAPLSERLAAALDARVICPDLVGHGLSEVPDSLDRYRVEAMAAQVAAVTDALGCGPFHLVGYSMGGRVALTIGCTEPQRLRSLTLIGASPGIADPQQRRLRVDDDDARAQRITADLSAFVDEWLAGPLFAGQAARGEAHVQAARAQRLAANPDGLARSLLAGGTGSMTPLHERLGACGVPTLVVSGADDSKFCTIADQLVAALACADAVRIAGAGHAAHVERPDDTAAAIAEFIATVEGRLASAETKSRHAR